MRTWPIDPASMSIRQKLPAVLAACAALGLAVAHLVVTLHRFPASGSVWRLLGIVLLPAVLAALLAGAAAATLRAGRPATAVRVGLVVGAVVMWALAIMMAIASVATSTPALLRPDGPGLWSVIGAPAFTILAWRHRGVRPKS